MANEGSGATLLFRPPSVAALAIAFHSAPRPLRIVGKDEQPILARGLRKHAMLVVDRGQRIQVESHDPSGFEMPVGGKEVGDVAGGLAGGMDHDGLHSGGMARQDADFQAGEQFAIALEEGHLAALDQGIVVGAEIAHAIALVLAPGVLPFGALHVIASAGEAGDEAVAAAEGIPAAMIVMKVGVDDDIHLVGGDAGGGEALEVIAARVHVPVAHLLVVELVAAAGLDEHGLAVAAGDEAVEAAADEVALVARRVAMPEGFGDDAEERAAIQRVGAVGDDGQLPIAERAAERAGPFPHGGIAFSIHARLPWGAPV